MEFSGIIQKHAMDILEIIVWVVILTTVIVTHGNKIKSLAGSLESQKDNLRENKDALGKESKHRQEQAEHWHRTCDERMDSVVTKTLLNAKLDGIQTEISHLNEGQSVLFKKVDDGLGAINKLLLDRLPK